MRNPTRLMLVLAFSFGGITLRAEQQTPLSQTIDQILLGLPHSPGIATRFPPPTPSESAIGPLTLTPPVQAGEFVRVRIPVGEFVQRLSKNIGNARRHRAEQKAQERVLRELATFEAAQPKRGR